MADSKLDVILRLQGARKFQSDASKSAGGVDKIGKAGDRTSKRLQKTGKQADRTRKHLRGIGTAAKVGMVGLGGLALVAGKNAVKSTQDLTKTTLGLQRATKMDAAEAVRWAAQAKVRGIDAKALNMAMGTLSKNQTLATEGGKAQTLAFKRLGITHAQVAATGGDVSKLLPLMADRFKAMGPSAERTASMMALMGRGWQTITPLMAEGSGFMNEQLGLAKKYGVTLGGKPIKTQVQMFQLQREMAMAQLGWQVQFSTVIAPKLIKGFQWILRASQNLKGIFKWAEKHPTITKAALALVAVGVAANKLRGLGLVFRPLIWASKTLWAKMGPGVRTAAVGTETTMAGASTASAARMRGGKGQAAWAMAGKVLGGVFIASFIAEAAGVENADPLLFLHPPEAGGETPAHKRTRRASRKGAAGRWLRGHQPFARRRPGESTEDLARRLGWKGRALGGVTGAGEVTLVGERGPELARFPTGTHITPTPGLRSLRRDGDVTIVSPVEIDGREVARVVAKHTGDKKARR